MANLKKDPAVIALIEDAVAKNSLAADKAMMKLRSELAKKVKGMAAEYAADARQAGNKDGAKRLMDFANDAAGAIKDQAA